MFAPFTILYLAESGTQPKDKKKVFRFSSFLKPGKNLRWFDYHRTNSGYQFKNYNSDLITLTMLDSRRPSDIIFKQDKVGNRLHTNITNMSSELRPFISHETGEQLVNLDIRNSQPLLFATLIQDHYKGQDLPEDAKLYIELTSAGLFYEHIMRLCGVPQIPGERKLFKKQFFGRVFFCENLHMDSYADAQVFKEHFPNVYELIRFYKRKDYKQLAIEMQKRESKIIIDTVCSNLFKEYGPDFFCLTIHDSIVVLKSQQELVKQCICNAFATLYGIMPTVNPEPFN